METDKGSIHLFFKFHEAATGDFSGIRTMEEHLKVMQSKGKVVWGHFTTRRDVKGLWDAKIELMQKQKENSKSALVFFCDREEKLLYAGRFLESYKRAEVEPGHPIFDYIPTYYQDRVGTPTKDVEGEARCYSYVVVDMIAQLQFEDVNEIFVSGDEGYQRVLDNKGMGSKFYVAISDELDRKAGEMMGLQTDFTPKIWIEKTEVNTKGREDRRSGSLALGRALWSPVKGKDGRKCYKTMLEPKKGDFVLHLIDNKAFSGISIIEEECQETEIKVDSQGDGTFYLIKLRDYVEFKNPIPREDFFSKDTLEERIEIAKVHEVFYTKNSELRQGAYLTPCGTRLLTLLNDIHRKHNSNANIPYIKSLLEDDESKGDPTQMVTDLKYPRNMILYGPPGTGKTYNTVYYAVAIIEGVAIDEIRKQDYFTVLERYNKYKDEERRISFTAFHQSYGYEEFIEGIKPNTQDDCEGSGAPQITFKVQPGVFKDFCERASQDAQEKSQGDEIQSGNYIFIIDEINRGNISKIFGELITLIENTKRIGAKEQLMLTLPYSKESFGVPENVYIIGTMNTADRSIALLDTALRRRFDFVEMMPDTKALEGIFIGEINVRLMLESMNRRIECLYDREHTIGHAYFTCLKEDRSFQKLGGIFRNEIIPLLQEYFYEDYQKIQLVLADTTKATELRFILDETVKVNQIFRANPYFDLPDKQYTIQTSAFENPASYISIYQE